MAKLFIVSHTKKQMAIMVEKFCSQCCGRQGKRLCTSRDCELYPIRIMRTVEPDQAHLFKVGLQADFNREVLRVVGTMPDTFWFSDLRSAVTVQPLSNNWWGCIPRLREWKQRFSQTGEYRPSPIPSSKSAAEFQYMRKVASSVAV